VVFTGSLIPLVVANESGVMLPMIYGLGTGVPVLALAVIIALGTKSLGATFRKMTSFEKWARRATGVIFIVVGIYLTLVYVFGVLS
jgi:cytochrome c biogenesis protein CcdA